MSRRGNDRVMRDSIADVMKRERRRRSYQEVSPLDVIAAGVEWSADACARRLAAGSLGLAHAAARIHAELSASQSRMLARRRAAQSS